MFEYTHIHIHTCKHTHTHTHTQVREAEQERLQAERDLEQAKARAAVNHAARAASPPSPLTSTSPPLPAPHLSQHWATSPVLSDFASRSVGSLDGPISHTHTHTHIIVFCHVRLCLLRAGRRTRAIVFRPMGSERESNIQAERPRSASQLTRAPSLPPPHHPPPPHLMAQSCPHGHRRHARKLRHWTRLRANADRVRRATRPQPPRLRGRCPRRRAAALGWGGRAFALTR